MGFIIETTCNDCKEIFELWDGGGRRFIAIHCDTCGSKKAMMLADLREKGIDYRDKKTIEELAGKCECGGSFRFNTPNRCPKCRSTNITLGKQLGTFS